MFWFPFQVLLDTEFRMFNNIFCEIYHIHYTAFKFDGYIKLVFQGFLLEVVEISIWSKFQFQFQ